MQIQSSDSDKCDLRFCVPYMFWLYWGIGWRYPICWYLFCGLKDFPLCFSTFFEPLWEFCWWRFLYSFVCFFMIFLSWLYFKIFVHSASFQCFFTYLFRLFFFDVFTNFNKSYKMIELESAMWGLIFQCFARMTWYEASTKIDKSFDKLYLTIKRF